MIITVRKIGNSQGVILDAALMELAHLKVGGKVNLEINPSGTITLTALHQRRTPKQISKVVKSTMKDYARTMKKLA